MTRASLRQYPNMSRLKSGNRVRFRNGGISIIREISRDDTHRHFPIFIKLKNFHAATMAAWCYDERGFCGNQTGTGYICPFDIMEILK
jgi:hypothetical protein